MIGSNASSTSCVKTSGVHKFFSKTDLSKCLMYQRVPPGLMPITPSSSVFLPLAIPTLLKFSGVQKNSKPLNLFVPYS